MHSVRTLVIVLLFPLGLAAQSPLLVSHGLVGQPANAESLFPQVSATGRYVLFTSYASNLVPDDTNGKADVFLRDLVTDALQRVSVAADGSQSGADSLGTDISATGRFVVFTSSASGLVPGGKPGLYVLDRQSGLLTEETIGINGQGAGTGGETGQISDDGSLLCFASASGGLVPADTNNTIDVFVRDRIAGVTERVSISSAGAQANGSSSGGWGANLMSDDGRFVVFDSQADNLVPLTPPCPQNVYLRDRATGQTLLLNATPAGLPGNGCAAGAAITADGRFAAFNTNATDLGPLDTNGAASSLYLHDTLTGELALAGLATSGGQPGLGSGGGHLSGDGRFVAFGTSGGIVEQDDNSALDVYVEDRLTELTRLASQGAGGTSGNGPVESFDISRDGRVVVFAGTVPLLPGASAFGDIYAWDRFNSPPWSQLFGGVAGAQGTPVFAAEGTLLPHAQITFALANAGPGGLATIVVGLSMLNLPFKGGVLVPSPDVLVPLAWHGGLVKFSVTWPNGIPSDLSILLQVWKPDATAPFGFSASDTLRGLTP